MKFKRGRTKIIVQLLACSIVFCATLFLFSKNSFASPGDHLVINEIYPCPKTGETEWIELYNPTGVDIELKDYMLASKHGSLPEEIFTFPSNYTIASQSFFTLAKNEEQFYGSYNLNPGLKFDNIVLANSSDYLILRAPAGVNDIDAVYWGESNSVASYTKSIAAGHSIERDPFGFDSDDSGKDFVDRKTPTPGTKFVAAETDIADSATNIGDARGLENGDNVTVIGTITALPNTLSSQYFYIQDATGGLQIYSYYKNFPEFKVGDEIKVSGELSEVSRERRLKLSIDSIITVLSHGAPLPPEKIEISDVDEKLEGQYIKIIGTVAETSGDTFVLEDTETHRIKVVIKSMTNIEKPKMHQGDQVEVSGIVSQYKDDYRILPISQNDVKILSDPLPTAGPDNYLSVLFAGITTILWKSFQKVKTRLVNLLKK